MSNDKKFIVRPKVRFCQTAESVQGKQVPSTSSHNQKKSEQLNKPQIRSVVTIKQPIRIVSHDQIPACISHQNDTDRHSAADTSTKCSLKFKHGSAPCLSEAVHSTSPNSIVKNSCSSNNQKDEKDVRESKNVVVNPNSSNLSGTQKVYVQHNESPAPNDQNIKIVPSKDFVASNSVTATISLNSQNNKEVNASKNITSKSTLQGTKYLLHDCGADKKKTSSNVRDAKIALKSNPPIKSITNQKKKVHTFGGTLKSRSAPCTSKETPKKFTAASRTASCMRKCTATKSHATKVMPCLRTARAVSKVTSPVRKTVLRDIVGHPIKTYVGPGVPRCTSNMFKAFATGKPTYIKPNIVSGEKLDRPEYNSIMCTINKLKEVQKENIVTDVEHLPMIYRNLVNGKISTALDFRLDETVYRNLVDLSIDENQLPSRLTRSKDPEPRQRDIVPKLSDFFIPEYAQEYYSAVHIRPRSPENMEIRGAFAISNKLFGWKHDMDHEQY